MTRLYFSVGRLRLRVLLLLLACMLVLGLAEILGFQGLFRLPSQRFLPQLGLVVLLMTAGYLVLGLISWRYLQPVAQLMERLKRGEPAPAEEPARQTALRFPPMLAAVSLGVLSAAVLVGLVINLLWLDLPRRLSAQLALGSFCIGLLAIALLYVLTRTLLRPVVAHFRHEAVPAGLRVGAGTKVALAIIALALAVDVTAAIIGANDIERHAAQQHARAQGHLAEAIAYGATALSPEGLRSSIARLGQLEQLRVRLTDTPEATASPLPDGAELSATYVSVEQPTLPESSPLPLLLLVLTLLALTALIGGTLGRNLSREIALVTERIRLMADPGESSGRRFLPLPRPQFSDVRQLAEALNDLLKRFTQINLTHYVAIEKTVTAERMKMQFLATVSHDLRSPLNAILGFSELLLRDTEDRLDDQSRQFIARIYANGQRLLRLIDEVLDLAKLEAGRITLHREDSLPTDIVRKALSSLKRDPLPAGVSLQVEIQPGMPLVWVDGHLLSQVIMHLVRFSVESIARGEVVLRVLVEPAAEGSGGRERARLKIRVADTSPGMEAEEAARIFSGFLRQPGRQGLGLGLPLAKALIEMHEGTLQVYSTPKVGNTFAADIPVLLRVRASTQLRPVKV